MDPVTLEVIRGRLDNVVEEMQHALLKASYSSIVNEAQDATSAILDARGRTIAQACAIPIHQGTLTELGRLIQMEYPAGTAQAGDMYIVNDPYSGGTHLPDFCVAAPVFLDTTLVGYVATMTHHQDIGGAAPGSASTDVYDHHSEGLRIPLTRLGESGQVDSDLISLLTTNSRSPENMKGDLYAQVASCRTGEHRLRLLFEQYGVTTTNQYIDHLLDYAERLTRLAISEIPAGEYAFSDFLDNEGLATDSDPVEIHVTIKVTDSDMHFDFSGSAKQVRAAINNVPSSTLSCVYFAIRALTGDQAPNNEGCYRPVSAYLPPGSIVNPTYPAAVNARGVAVSRIMDTVMGALAQAVPSRICAAGCGHANVFLAGGIDGKGSSFTGILGGPLRSGTGARPSKDGIDVADHELSNVFHVPLEVTESEFPLRYRRVELWTDSGGAGKWRGGLGFKGEIDWLEGSAILSLRGERHKFQPWGLAGGLGSPVCRNEMELENGSVTQVPAKIVQPIKAGQTFRYWSTGGGGHGLPADRPAEMVFNDVMDGRVSTSQAKEIYGVIVESGKLQLAETDACRRKMEVAGAIQ